MALGVCCQWLKPNKIDSDANCEYVNCLGERHLQLGKFSRGLYSRADLERVYSGNAASLVSTANLVTDYVKCFRISSSLMPLADHVSESVWLSDLVKDYLAAAGKIFMDNDCRVTTHPGQFCVLSSDKPDVVMKAIKELEIHTKIFDAMGFPRTPEYAINVHGGKSDRLEKLISVILSLDPAIRSRLTLENDESCYSVADLSKVHQETGVPIVFDSHHHTFNTGGISLDHAFEIAVATWSGIKPLQHLSNTTPGLENGNKTERRKHSDYIHYVPPLQLAELRADTIDVEVEAKMKNLAVLKMRRDFNLNC